MLWPTLSIRFSDSSTSRSAFDHERVRRVLFRPSESTDGDVGGVTAVQATEEPTRSPPRGVGAVVPGIDGRWRVVAWRANAVEFVQCVFGVDGFGSASPIPIRWFGGSTPPEHFARRLATGEKHELL